MLLHTTFRQTVLKSKKYGSNRTSGRRLVPESMKWDPKKNDRVKATNHIGLSMLLASPVPFFKWKRKEKLEIKEAFVGSLNKISSMLDEMWVMDLFGSTRPTIDFCIEAFPSPPLYHSNWTLSDGICSFRMIGNDWELLISSETFNITWRKEWLVDNNACQLRGTDIKSVQVWRVIAMSVHPSKNAYRVATCILNITLTAICMYADIVDVHVCLFTYFNTFATR